MHMEVKYMSQISLETKDNSEEKIKYNFKEITIRD